ncbi:MAG: hypothetical protein IVW57_04675 [Ktedonobacterales bacterium]|nr:hypothetical protein [Ktedonobacterales bacterium]
MGLLERLIGGGAQHSELQSFVQRFEQGAPEQGYSEQEALSNYQRVAPQLSQGDFLQASEAAFSRLSPEQRGQFGQILQQQAQQRGINVGALGQQAASGQVRDPGQLAQLTGVFHQRQPGLLGEILGGVTGGGGGGGGGGSLLSNPVAKAALGGIAAMAIKRAMARR